MADSAIALASRALVALGARAIASFEEGTVEAEVAATLYPGVADGLLAAHPWRFATARARLARLDAKPVAGFAHAFQLPSDTLRVLSADAGDRRRGIDYRVVEHRLHADAEPVHADYLFRPAETLWPAFFARAVVARLAAELCLPVTESASRAELLHRRAEDAERRARLVDSQQDVAPALQGFPLIEVRS